VDSFEDEVRIAIVGKYTGLADAYLSIIKVSPTLSHASDAQ
jgi:CTP synthase (UTP-ammonia lyase)